MKRILAVTVLIVGLGLITGRAGAQTYFLGNGFTNGGSITTCGGFFYDTNPTGNYGNSQNYVVTFIPATAGRKMRLDFTEIGISLGDSLEVFDGTSVTAPRLVLYNAANNFPIPITASIANTTNALTVRFRSDTGSVAPGWRAALKCVFPCQPITGSVSINGLAPDVSGFLPVCRNVPLLITANMSYPQSGQAGGYTQTNALNRFTWQFGGFANDTAATGLATVNRSLTQQSGYYLNLIVADTNGCTNAVPIQVKVAGSVKPTINAAGGIICFGDTGTITGNFQKNSSFFVRPPFQGKTNVPLADNVGPVNQCNASYSDTILINSFVAGTNLTNINDFIGITVNMEHSYIGDFDLQMIAPNGTVIQLKPFIFPAGLGSSGGGTDFGEPVPGDGLLPNPSGKGYIYRFTPQALRSIIETIGPGGALAPIHTYVGTNGTNYTDTYVPAGDYAPRKEAPATPFTNMLNTPLNGRWILRYCDNYTSDNGTLFSWKLEFAASLPTVNGPAEQYSIGIKDARFMPATGLLSSVTTGTSTVGRVFPPVPLVYNYMYRVTDSANCNYDTVVKVFGNPRPLKAAFTGDTVICRNATSTLQVAAPAANTTYQWYSNAQGTGTPITTGTSFTTPALAANTTYYVKATNIAQCSKIDTINIRILQPLVTPVVVVNNPTLNTLTFTWAAVPGATGYQVSVDSGATYITPSSGATGLTHTLAGLRPFLTRTILVRALATIACQNSEAGRGSGTTLLDELYVPNVFTPNGDGKNDIWKPYGWLIKELSINIFNQWGQQIYATRDANGGWDGTVKGKQQPVGVYVFVIRVVDQNGRVLDRKGSINLVR